MNSYDSGHAAEFLARCFMRLHGYRIIAKNYVTRRGTAAGEVDFIATKSEEKIYIQVTYLLIEEETIKREFGVFKDIDDNYLKYVISLDKCNFSRDGIIHKNIIAWLLED